jgi:hypothetical protein
MIRSSFVLVAGMVALGCSVALGEAIPPQPVSGNIQWVYDYADAQRQARETGKPLFVVFRCER